MKGGHKLIKPLGSHAVGSDLGVDVRNGVGVGRGISIVEAVEVGHAEFVAAAAELVEVAGS